LIDLRYAITASRVSDRNMKTPIPRRREAGQALILTAAALVVLMGFAGLAIDMGVMRYEKRLEQTAADAAAIAGASDAIMGSTAITNGALDAATRVGFTDNGGGQVSNCAAGAAVGTVCVQVNNPPATGLHSGNSNYVEVLVAVVQPTYFMKILSINSQTITARAVAANLGSASGDSCMYVMGLPSEGLQGLDISGNATLNASNCRIVDVGDYSPTGGAFTINAYSIGVSGNLSGSGSGRSVTCVSTGPCPTFGIPASGDPLQNFQAPPMPAPPSGNTLSTLNPGTYSSIAIGSGSTVTMNPGLYYVNGTGVSITGNAIVTGSGVMIYLTGGASINIAGTAHVQLTAPNNTPSTGTYPGILIFEDTHDTATTATIGGDNTSFFDGALYFPEAKLTLSGGAGGGFNVAIVDADQVMLGSNTVVNLQGSAGLPPGVNLITNATIVE
jgi:Flp pilus assembly protein TadG